MGAVTRSEYFGPFVYTAFLDQVNFLRGSIKI